MPTRARRPGSYGRRDDAVAAYRHAIALTTTDAERRFLSARLRAVEQDR